MDTLLSLLAATFVAYGLAVLLVEKKDDWPIRFFSLMIRYFIRKYISTKFSKVLKCTICASFWMALIADSFLYLFTFGNHSFLWPLSGVTAAGLTWTIIEFMNILDGVR